MINWLHKNRRFVARGLGSVIALVLLVVLLEEEGDGVFFSTLRRVSFGYFWAALFALFLSRLFAAGRWYILLTSAGVDITFFRSIMLTFTGNFSSNFLPTTVGGDVVRLAGTMQLGYDRAICLASLVADRLIGLIGMGFVLPISLSIVLPISDKGILQSSIFFTLFQSGLDFIKRTFKSFSIWFKKPVALSNSLIATFGNMIFIYLAIYFLLISVNHHISYWLIAGLYTLTYFVTLIPISINGLGVQELSLTFLLVQVSGLSSSEGATIAFLTRILFIITSIPGAFFLPSILASMSEKSLIKDSNSD